MCGIVGTADFTQAGRVIERSTLASMVGAIAHRGPDGFGIYRDDRVGLAHARLSLVDLQTGDQPLANHDRSIWTVFNGEIFNYVELRRELEASGFRFRTRSDTEVLVHAYEAWGTACFSRFNGQWAVAIWDTRTGELVLSRDRVGICPLYLHEHGGRVWFASEVKALFAHPEVPRALSPEGVDQTFTYWSPIAPVTIFAGIDELRPGTFRRYRRDGSWTEGRSSPLTFPPKGTEAATAIEDAAEILRDKLATASRLRMVQADVPVACYLSGGLDSSVITALGRTAATGELRTYSLGFEDAEFDESSFQRSAARLLGGRHESVTIGRRDLAEVFPDAVYHAERPLLRTAPAPMFLLSRLVRSSGIKGVLTGEGADEVLAGYDVFREAWIREFWSRAPESTIRPRLFERIYPYLARSPARARGMANAFWKQGLDRAGRTGFSHGPRWSTTRGLTRFYSADLRSVLESTDVPDPLDALPAEFGTWATLAQAQYLEITTLLSPYILSAQGDRMLMGNSVEGRYPFLDSDVIDFCASLPPTHKLLGLNEKRVLKLAATGMVPDEIVRRKKQPYRAPGAECFAASDAPDYVEEMLSADAVAAAGLFEPTAVTALHRKVRSATAAAGPTLLSNSDSMALVGILSAQLVHRLLVSTGPRPPTVAVEFTTEIDRTSAAAS